jgi:hypothetical protein
MPDTNLRDELGKMLDQYDERRRAVLAREQKVRDEDAAFLAGFAQLRRAVARPVFELAATMLAERGHKVAITEHEYSVDAARKVTEASIAITIVPSGAAAPPREEQAHALEISTRHYNKTVWINGGVSFDSGTGARGAYSLERVDRELIEMVLVRFVAKLVEA